MYTVTINFPFDCHICQFMDGNEAMRYYADIMENHWELDEDVTSINMKRDGELVAFFKPEEHYA